MSEQDDLDDNDKLFILLASMKEYREAIADDKKRLEQFYNHVASDVLDKAEKSLQSTNKRAMDALNKSIQELNTATGRLIGNSWRYMPVHLWRWPWLSFWRYLSLCQAWTRFRNVGRK